MIDELKFLEAADECLEDDPDLAACYWGIGTGSQELQLNWRDLLLERLRTLRKRAATLQPKGGD